LRVHNGIAVGEKGVFVPAEIAMPPRAGIQQVEAHAYTSENCRRDDEEAGRLAEGYGRGSAQGEIAHTFLFRGWGRKATATLKIIG
jgi:hypothetical protein